MHAAMKNVRNATEQQHSCIVQKTRTCSYGEVRYKLASALIGANGYTLTEEFKNAVRLLPLNYSQEAYTQFIDDWGTVSHATAIIYCNCIVIPFSMGLYSTL